MLLAAAVPAVAPIPASYYFQTDNLLVKSGRTSGLTVHIKPLVTSASRSFVITSACANVVFNGSPSIDYAIPCYSVTATSSTLTLSCSGSTSLDAESVQINNAFISPADYAKFPFISYAHRPCPRPSRM